MNIEMHFKRLLAPFGALWLILAVLWGGIAPGSAAADVPLDGHGFFIADDDGATLENPAYLPSMGDRFARLRPEAFRLMIPWNAKEGPPAGVEEGHPNYKRYEERQKWLARTHAMIDRAEVYGVDTIILTLRSNTHREYPNMADDFFLPTPFRYEFEAAKVVKEFAGKVDVWGGINEPNLWPRYEGACCRRIPVATLVHFQASIAEIVNVWEEAGTPVTSPDFNDETAKWEPYVENFKSAFQNSSYPGDGFGNVAAFHPYSAVNTEDLSTVNKYAKIVPGTRPIWVTEAGVHYNSETKGGMRYNSTPATHAAKVAWMTNKADGLASQDRVTRIGYYHMRDHNPEWDSALLNEDQTPRPAWNVWCAASHNGAATHADCSS